SIITSVFEIVLFPSIACGLECYSCTQADPASCTNTESCSSSSNRCSNVVSRGCHDTEDCAGVVSCCAGNLCNSAIPTGPSAILLLVSSAILKLLF
uniref:UPAR/Ly6 domain-containing protein n=1 Tax=Amphilophus citrinellus TaxID=61819 RepID=A0A3Q0RB83_AMPCI